MSESSRVVRRPHMGRQQAADHSLVIFDFGFLICDLKFRIEIRLPRSRDDRANRLAVFDLQPLAAGDGEATWVEAELV